METATAVVETLEDEAKAIFREAEVVFVTDTKETVADLQEEVDTGESA